MADRLITARSTRPHTGRMPNRSRGLRRAVVRALSRVGLVWALAVLGALFMAMSAQGLRPDGGYSLGAADPSSLPVDPAEAPSPLGVALALAVLGAGLLVLALGATRTGPRRVPVPRRLADRASAPPAPFTVVASSCRSAARRRGGASVGGHAAHG
jgi:hypothetical protein